MTELLGIDSYLRELRAWGRFTTALREINRHVAEDKAYLERVTNVALGAATPLNAGTELYRARRVPFDRLVVNRLFTASEMGAPPPSVAAAGRVNPEGIVCLYAASNANTAIAEVRPYVSAVVCVATLVLVESVRIVDLTATKALRGDGAVIRCLSRMFAQPAHDDDRLSYTGTQFLAEVLKSRGIDGIRFMSAVREDGWNVALFDPSVARVSDVRPYDVQLVSYVAVPQDPGVEALRAAYAGSSSEAS